MFLLQELQLRGLSVPVLISIRDEDYNLTQLNGKYVRFDIVELSLSEQEARNIYDLYAKINRTRIIEALKRHGKNLAHTVR